MHYCAFERIERFHFVEGTKFRRDFWNEKNIEIMEVPNKWKI